MGLFSKIISKLRGGETPAAKKASSAPGSKKGGKKPQHKKSHRKSRPEGAKGQPDAQKHGEASHRGPRPKSTTATPGKKQGGQRPHHKSTQRDGQYRGPKGERSHEKRMRPASNKTPASQERPGGAFTEAQLAEYAAAHAAWDVNSYVVPAEEGKIRFTDLALPSEILHAVSDLGFQYCTPIQAQSLEFSLEGKNVAGRAQTGTGKTAAFLIAILTRYLRTPEKRQRPGAPRALVLAPTRELVIQICKDAAALGKYCGDVRSLAIYGGMDYERQRRELEEAPVDLLVATPGRLLDFVRSRVVDLRQVDTLVIDEADRMLDMGFIPDVRAIINRLPDRDARCTMLYSATLNETVMRLASMWMREPVRVEIESDSLATDTVRQIVYIARAEEKFTLLYNHLARYADARTIIFCNRKFTTERICDQLNRLNIPCEMLSGDVAQAKRMRVLEDFREGKIRTLVATDVAGRGIHVDDVAFVVNYDFPYEPEDYVHRIGRTGRAGNTGTAISFADEDESFIIPDIEKYINETLSCTMPEEWMYAALPEMRARRKKHQRGDRPVPQPVEAQSEVASADEPQVAPVEPDAPVAEPIEEVKQEVSESVVEAAPVEEAPSAEPASPTLPEVALQETSQESPKAEPPAPQTPPVAKVKEDVRPERMPRFKPHGRHPDAHRKGEKPRGPRQRTPQGKAPRGEKPVAARFERTQAQGPRDGSESHHAISPSASPRPLYMPEGRRVFVDEWTPGQ